MKEADCEEVVLEAEVSNGGALALYENLGFIRDKRLQKCAPSPRPVEPFQKSKICGFRSLKWPAVFSYKARKLLNALRCPSNISTAVKRFSPEKTEDA